MVQFPGNPDILIIGAGAAGVGAGRTLARSAASFGIIEAKDRIGGRAYSESHSLGSLWDHGCHWFHSADKNILRMIAEGMAHRFPPQPRSRQSNNFLDGAWVTTPIREDYVWKLLGEIADAGRRGEDRPASALLDPAHPWYPMIRHWVTLMYSAEPEDVSTFDAGQYDDTGINLTVEDGYGALIVRLAEGLPIRTGVAASKIEVTATGVAVTTQAGVIEAKTVIVAVPARALETGRLVILPAMPDAVRDAFRDTPMGYYEKIAFGFDRPVFEGRSPYADIFDPVAPTTHPLNFELHPFGRPIAVTHIAGDFAREMERAGEAGMIDFALETLVRAFGSALRQRVKTAVTTRWSSDPFIAGAYSCAKPGRGLARREFTAPVHERLFLAGEHVHQHFFATAHGAFETGISAAKRALAKIGVAAGA
ncbi:NAD(P)/FAD-dependent oxidoreductase [soil metagenome]